MGLKSINLTSSSSPLDSLNKAMGTFRFILSTKSSSLPKPSGCSKFITIENEHLYTVTYYFNTPSVYHFASTSILVFISMSMV